MTVDALADRPELRICIGRAQALGAAYVESGRNGPVALYWPPEPSCSPRATYMGPKDEVEYLGSADPAELVAAFLAASDVEAAASTYEDGLRPSENRRERLAVVRAVAEARARERCSLLRALRRGEPPPGSVCLAVNPFIHRPHPLVRFPDGRGLYTTAIASFPPWSWNPSFVGPILRVLALGLDEARCREAVRAPAAGRPEDELARVEAHLRAKGLA